MCHEKYHVDPDLRAIANRLTGLPMAESPASKERSQTASQLLLNVACCEGLVCYVDEMCQHLPSGERHRIYIRLRSIRQRFANEAEQMIAAMDTADEVPF